MKTMSRGRKEGRRSGRRTRGGTGARAGRRLGSGRNGCQAAACRGEALEDGKSKSVAIGRQSTIAQIENILDKLRSIGTWHSTKRTGELHFPKDANSTKGSEAAEERNSGRLAVVDKRRCAVCGVCIAACPEHAISLYEEVTIDQDRCEGCGTCVEECPNEAISLSERGHNEQVREKQSDPNFKREVS